MDDKDNERDDGVNGTDVNDDQMELEEAVAAVTLPSTLGCTLSPSSTLNNHSSEVYSNSHHTQVRRSTDDREEDLLLESEENPRRQQYDVLAGRVRMQEPLAQTACFKKREEDDLARQTSTSNPQDELLTSIARSLENVSLQTTCTPQQESCGRHLNDPSDRRLENATQLRRGGLVDIERILSK